MGRVGRAVGRYGRVLVELFGRGVRERAGERGIGRFLLLRAAAGRVGGVVGRRRVGLSRAGLEGAVAGFFF